MKIPSWLDGAVIALVLSAAVRALPEPAPQCKGFWQKFYLWFFNFTHGIMANLDKIRGNEVKNNGSDTFAGGAGQVQ